MPRSPKPIGPMRCVCAGLRRTARLLSRHYEEALRPAGVSPSQFELLSTLQAMKAADQAQLVKMLETDQTTLSRNLKLLLAQGWVETAQDERDARRRVYRVSDVGQAVLREASELWYAVHERVHGLLGEHMEEVWPALDRIQDVARRLG